jgi:hypothetical protein
MDAALQKDLQTSIRQRTFATMEAGAGLVSDVIDFGQGFSPVGFIIDAALAGGTILTFKVQIGDHRKPPAAPTADQLMLARNHVSDGTTAASSYGILVADDLGWFPLSATVFRGVHFLQVVSSEDNSDAVIEFCSQPQR